MINIYLNVETVYRINTNMKGLKVDDIWGSTSDNTRIRRWPYFLVLHTVCSQMSSLSFLFAESNWREIAREVEVKDFFMHGEFGFGHIELGVKLSCANVHEAAEMQARITQEDKKETQK